MAMFAFLTFYTPTPTINPCFQDLTGQVAIKLQPGRTFRWTIGTGGSATVYKGQWLWSQNDPPVAIILFSHCHIFIVASVV